MERVTDKRKARDKETDSEASDTSLNKNPTKRPRVDFSSSASSPMEKSPSPASAQRSPMKSASVADSLNAATPGPTLDENERNSNGELVASSTTNSNGNGGGSEAAAGIPKFDLPSPFTTQELEEKIGKNSETKEDSDSDNGSTKFLSGIIQSEENKRKRQGKGKGRNNGNSKDARKNGTPSPVSNAKRNAMKQRNSKSPGKASYKPLLTSSPLSDLVSWHAL